MATPSEADVQPAVQHEAVDARPILTFVILSLLGMGLVVWLSTFWFMAETENARQRAIMEARYPELERLDVAGRAQLNRYALEADSTYMIPVERAIEVLATEYPEAVSYTSELP